MINSFAVYFVYIGHDLVRKMLTMSKIKLCKAITLLI